MNNPHHTDTAAHDPTNPRVLGLPLGVVIAIVVAVASMALVMLKFYVH